MRSWARFGLGLLLGAAPALGLHSLLDRAERRRLAPALAARLGEPVSLGGLEVTLAGALRLDGVSVGRLAEARSVELSRDLVDVGELRIGTPGAPADAGALARVARAIGRLANGGARKSAAGSSATRWPSVVLHRGELNLSWSLARRPVEVRFEGLALGPGDDGERLLVHQASVRDRSGHALSATDAAIDLTVGPSPAIEPVRLAATGVRLVTPAGETFQDGSLYATFRRPLAFPFIASARWVAPAASGAPIELKATADTATRSLRVEMTADALPLATLVPAGRWLDASRATASLKLDALLAESSVAFEVNARLRGVGVDSRAIAPQALSDLSFAVGAKGHAELAIDGGAPTGRLALDSITVQHEGTILRGAGVDIERSAAGLAARGRIELPPTDCAALLAATPPALIPALAGLAVSGSVSGSLDFAVDSAHPEATTLAGRLDTSACRAAHDPLDADVAALAARQPLALDVSDGHGGRRRVTLGPGAPGWVRLSDMSPLVPAAFIAAEDGRFLHHHGFDLAQIRRALVESLQSGRLFRGASTLTQQLARNLYLTPERSLSRKLEEAVLAWRLERALAKGRILELYLNLVELGDGVYGIGAGAAHWFGRAPADLDARQAAFLALLAPAPRAYGRRVTEARTLDEPLPAPLEQRLRAILLEMYVEGALPLKEYRAALRPAATTYTPM